MFYLQSLLPIRGTPTTAVAAPIIVPHTLLAPGSLILLFLLVERYPAIVTASSPPSRERTTLTRYSHGLGPSCLPSACYRNKIQIQNSATCTACVTIQKTRRTVTDTEMIPSCLIRNYRISSLVSERQTYYEKSRKGSEDLPYGI